MALRFVLLFCWCVLATVVGGYLVYERPLIWQALILAVTFGLIGLGFWWYSRSLPRNHPAAAVWPDLPRQEQDRKAAVEERTGKSFERLRSEASLWLRDNQVHDYNVHAYASLSPRIRAIVDAEVLAGNTVKNMSCDMKDGEIVRTVVTMQDPFGVPHTGVLRSERWGWEHFYVDPETGHEVKAIFNRSSAENPLLCEHLRDVESAIHRAGIPLLSQYGDSRGRWLRFHCDMDLDATRQRYGLSEFVHAYEEDFEVGRDWFTERRLYCTLCGCGIEETGGPTLFPAATSAGGIGS